MWPTEDALVGCKLIDRRKPLQKGFRQVTVGILWSKIPLRRFPLYELLAFAMLRSVVRSSTRGLPHLSNIQLRQAFLERVFVVDCVLTIKH